mmetsp:Transcript_10601/g.35055  ORF Transcript_10601/g.35055 Transcript_10601/m.35055 type:complete len:305 (+) Transcript_10601:185-1099(+)|eukprot:CAMPEP_0118916708 /NCGR_PEP_ID=MMETSP1166-20130328/16641_1 /TAXON_ID=1104430 /ORGANISM="Chrysoreinhardia sp, Strain CCMP3193" /LENGTH=304 /DNA_ID=CAMNT_0006856617 /DNA_START=179 /DNA_END=1093 /DNA_ORIENTATION=+
MAMGSLCVLLVLTAQAVAPLAMENPFGKFSKSTSSLIRQQREWLKLRSERKSDPSSIDFVKYHAMQRAADDMGKFGMTVFLAFYIRWYTPAYLYFCPGGLPSHYNFRVAEEKLKKVTRLVENRRKVVFEAVSEAAVQDVAAAALSKPTKEAALDEILKATAEYANSDASLKKLPGKLLYVTSRAFHKEGPWRIFPKGFHSRSICDAVKHLADGDETLRRSDLASIPTDVLEDACVERSLLTSNRETMIKGLDEWLHLTDTIDQKEGKHAPPSTQTRLALLGLNSASLCRHHDKSFLALYGQRTF